MKFSLDQQIEEIDRELDQRARVYPHLVATAKLRQSIADYQVERLKAAKATLQWLRDNEVEVRAYVAEKKKASAA